jgi:hypothetical protein
LECKGKGWKVIGKRKPEVFLEIVLNPAYKGETVKTGEYL